MTCEDYSVYALEERLEFTQTINNVYKSILESEHEYIISCLKEGVILEAGELGDQNTKKVSLWERIKTFFANLFNKFKDKSIKNVNDASKWIKKNQSKLGTIDFNGVELKVVKYRGAKALMQDVSNILSILDRKSREVTSFNSRKEITTEELEKVTLSKYLDASGNLSNGLKMQFRVGSPRAQLQYTSISGDAAKAEINAYIEYCTTYTSKIVPWIRNIMTRIETDIKDMESLISKRSLTAKEGVYINLIESYNTDLFILTEDGKDVDPNKVEVNINQNDKQRLNEKENANKIGQSPKTEKLSDNGLKKVSAFLEIEKLVCTSAMTVLEEMFVVYTKVLKAVLNPDSKDNAANNEES